MRPVIASAISVGILVFTVFAQDPKERDYLVPALSPQHADKPKVKGWAGQRVEEKLDRGLTAVRLATGKVYLSWRMLKGDPSQVAFNVYRAAGDRAEKLNTEPISATTDFIDAKIPTEISGPDIV